MDRKIAEKLVSELRRQARIVIPDTELFLNELISADVPESSRFYEDLPDKQQFIEETGRYNYLSLRRVLRNRNAGKYRLPQWKKAYESFMSALGVYSSDALSRSLRVNDTILSMMERCEEPFSLLGKFKSYDFEDPDGKLFIATLPVLVIPGIRDMKPIYDWENANMVCEEETRFMRFFPTRKRIKLQEYLSH